MRAFSHQVALVPQQSPPRNPGGDCFAAAVLAALRHFFPERPPTYDQVWEAFRETQQNPDGSTSTYLTNTWHGMRDALYRLHADWPLAIEYDIVFPSTIDVHRGAYSWGFHVDGYTWARRLDAWLRAGHLALGEIKLDASETGEWARHADGNVYRNHIDHFVLYDGVRSGWRAHPGVSGARTLVYQIHVVCSARGGRTYWIDVDDLLTRHGAGAAWWLIRPDERGNLPTDSGE